MSKIPINEVYFVSKHVKSSKQRGVLRRWSRTEVSQSSMSRISINEVYFVSKQACAKRARERARERERERERGREGEGQAWQEFQSTRCTSSPSMSRIPINEVYFVSINELYFVSKHVKNSNQRGILCLRGALRRWSGTGVGQPSASRILVNEVYFVSKLVCAKRAGEREGGREGERERERERGREGGASIPINQV